jgi:hypothetical protein
MSDHAYGLWAALAVDNTAKPPPPALSYSDAGGRIAVLAKTARNATIGFIVLGYAIYWARQRPSEGHRPQGRVPLAEFSRSSCSASSSSPRWQPRGRSRELETTDLANLVALGVSADVCRASVFAPTSAV